MAVKKVSKRKVDAISGPRTPLPITAKVPEPEPQNWLVTFKEWVFMANGCSYKAAWGPVLVTKCDLSGDVEYTIGTGNRRVSVKASMVSCMSACTFMPPINNARSWSYGSDGSTADVTTPNQIWLAHGPNAWRIQDAEPVTISVRQTTRTQLKDTRTFWQRLTGVPAGWSNRI